MFPVLLLMKVLLLALSVVTVEDFRCVVPDFPFLMAVAVRTSKVEPLPSHLGGRWNNKNQIVSPCFSRSY